MQERNKVNRQHAGRAMSYVIAKSENKYPMMRFFCTLDMMKVVAYKKDELNEDQDLPETQESLHAKT
ncbi:hypothetical protein E6Q11_06610 [Candidatus Dojkabacteria bacterium]|uniref:Uncharacterized protein n=1 Tax=Candidatus Dojkabacteria bacterium TaxID=2099670 RepID=A0A5C7J359_9BACT|nr:MAG: hypothetical protein E6Q11_06610 [Candidatus Dojkabacteria bacterium]